MDLTFATPDLEATANSSSKLDKRFGAHARLVRQRLFELAAAENLAVLAEIPTLRFAPKHRNRFSIAAGKAGNIEFTAAGGATHRPESVTTIRILAIGHP
jgi:hypothetical protein